MSDDIKARARAVLDGIGSPQWRALTTGVAGGDHWYICDDDQSVAMVSASDGEDEELRQPRAEFIAAAPDLVRELLAALETADGVIRKVEKFITARTEYITALNNSRGGDVNHDYWRWQGGAEARRQLANDLGIPVPHNAGDKAQILGGAS